MDWCHSNPCILAGLPWPWDSAVTGYLFTFGLKCPLILRVLGFGKLNADKDTWRFAAAFFQIQNAGVGLDEALG